MSGKMRSETKNVLPAPDNAGEEEALGTQSTNSQPEIPEPKKAKRKRRNNKQKDLGVYEVQAQSNEHLRLVGSWPANAKSHNTDPPTLPVDNYTTRGNFPLGEIEEHPGINGAGRVSDPDALERETAEKQNYDDYRKAAEVHRLARKFAQGLIKPGVTTLEVCQKLEAKVKELLGGAGVAAGWAFPTGISLNECAAHYTPNYGEDPVVIREGDIVKLDFGVHVGGRLVDSAFTVAFDEKFDPLIKATQDGTNTGLRLAGVDARFSEIGEAIEEAISSYEMEIQGKTLAIKPISNLSGHTVDVYRVHASRSLPFVKNNSELRMAEGEVYAIETFASTGKGEVWSDGPCSHYMLSFDWANDQSTKKVLPKTPSGRKCLQTIKANHSTLAFCRRWLDDEGCPRHLLGLRELEQLEIVDAYPPLVDVRGCFTSQMEHTVMIRPTCKEILTRGPDY